MIKALLLRSAANEWGWIKSAPVIKTKKPVSKRIRGLTRDEANRLIDCCGESIRPIVTFALVRGCDARIFESPRII